MRLGVGLWVPARLQAQVAADDIVERLVAISFSVPQLLANCLGHPDRAVCALAGLLLLRHVY